MGTGLFLIVVGALLSFAVEGTVPHLNLDVAGVILMLAGGVLMAHARATAGREHVVTRREESSDPSERPHVVQQIVRDRRVE